MTTPTTYRVTVTADGIAELGVQIDDATLITLTTGPGAGGDARPITIQIGDAAPVALTADQAAALADQLVEATNGIYAARGDNGPDQQP
ncbi:hypothetical protein GOHSU_19_00030 [Gordonia hirsuta DSM 44140 = NBRC 16056]|uniref:Uncharacterized protein n=1 Tax=Gordonia hirsuta DSM 44140 = NBRC 16056 TaxID=1121927 RepID=L7L8C6_9ACTN|nr:hypothetical protein [Gordonia hirsuta]GAC57400.1 hypothetical protein GOHSU_19_00030 [Gordonia hirsuta DSM 44140 = NBRC 16056]